MDRIDSSASPGLTERGSQVSIVIPSWDGVRGGRVAKLMESIEGQSSEIAEIIVIKGVAPQGKAINQGVRKSKGDIVIIVDDDSCLADESVVERLVDVLRSDAGIGMAGASIVLGPDANEFQRRAAGQFPRLTTPVVDEVTDSDLACHGCCAMPRNVFDEVGGEREDILRGLDPDLRQRIRVAGYRVVLAPHAKIHHPLPENMPKLVKTFFRNGYGSAYAQKFRPDTVYDTHEALHAEGFKPRRSLAYRVARFPVRLAAAVVQGKTLRLAAYLSYAGGYAWGLVTAREHAA